MVNDPISDMVVRLKNASLAGRPRVIFPASGLKLAVAEKLKQAGYLKTVTKLGKKVKKVIEAELVYEPAGRPKIRDVSRVSRPSRRVYHRRQDIRPVRQGYGLAIYSTPNGILTGEEARKANVGGEILFKIW